MRRGIDQWWRSPDHHRLMTAYLAKRRLQPAVQLLMAAGTAAYGAAATAMLFSPDGPTGQPAVAACITVAVSSALIAAYWVRRWPTLRASIAIVVLSLTGLALVCLAQSGPEAGLLGSTGFAVLAGYVAFVHSARLLAVVIAAAVATVSVCIARLALAGDIAMALSIVPVALVALVILPFAGQLLARLLGADAHHSDTDALTGLLNRRGFHSAATELAARLARTPGGRLTIAIVDLDHFKAINDTLGHLAGDQILVEVGAALLAAADDNALVVRFGGEEFLVAEVQSCARDDLGSRLVAAFDDAKLGVTASVGVDNVRRLPTDPEQLRVTLDRLLTSADNAMYAAKRAGGNAVCHAGARDTAAA
ncbi:GGDEF domain-containing protein [Mycolicibacterium sp. BiH015]|uniref:GGDEF domain-containing protein n=1 Tax=Mycolicibacterium sp. BiH015 TaxID=3018808 RepID=UPI0022E2FAF5|nr:GGDEF domain-containing protein [Mycolicibacterium sp. BiH015]MDA2891112.1 GGDEF domain-containing protein [Mycolicibacterium sp. BiH015]